MKNRQTIFAVLVFAVVASLLTMAARSRTSFLNQRILMPMFGGGVEVGLMPERVPEMVGNDVTVEKMMAEPSLGIMPINDVFLPPHYGDDALDVEDRVYQKTSYHSVVVDDVPVYLRGIKEYILSINGRVLNSSISSGEDYNSGSLTVKVPVEKFDEATGRVTDNVDRVVEESIDSYDVTGQLVNTTENLQALKDAKSLKEAALIDAKTEVEKRRYQIEIERLERQIASAEKGLDRVEQKVEYSTISIAAADSMRYFDPNARLSIGKEFLRAWTSLKQALKVVGKFGIWVLVYSIIWLPVIWIFRRLTRRSY